MAYELREMFEAGELEGDVNKLQGSKQTSVFTDEKGLHAGEIMIHQQANTGTLIWLHAIHGVEPLDVWAYLDSPEWNTDIRVIADSLR